MPDALHEFYEQRPEWSAPSAEDGLERATISVPRDYDDPQGVQLTIAVSRLRATDPAKRRGVLLSVNGGPGGDNGEGLRLPLEFPAEVREAYDLIGFDPRGIGESTKLYSEVAVPVAPFDSRPPDSLFEQIAVDMRERELACARAGGDLRQHITTRNISRDMDVIRGVLGEEQISFVGYAYGTLVGAVYGSMFPAHLDRSVLDSCVNPNWTWREQFVTQAEGVYRNVQKWAQWTAERNVHFGLGTSAAAVLETVEEVVSALEEFGAIHLRTLFDGAVGTRATDRAQWDSLGYLVGDLRKAEDVATAQQLIAGNGTWRPQDTTGELRIGVLEAITMETEWPSDLDVYFNDMRHHREHHPYGFGVLRAQPWVGAFRTFENLEEPTYLKRIGYPVGLCVQADGDQYDRYEGGVAMAERLGHHLVVIEDSGDHEVYAFVGNKALDDIVNAYLVDGVLPGERVTVPGSTPRPDIPADA
ncbi:alpha/beta fold hydrolase [Lentzea sp. NPDC058436]|uniref:alpha/beta fold hydrolase n=1 Tax=Lentzea sp. NPDC058436 TaxID=3346499 RepID=UPI00365715C9